MEKISTFMTHSVTSISSSSTVSDALEVMRKKRIGAILITDKGGPCGIFTERDFLLRINHGKDCNICDIKLYSVMTKDLLIASPDEPYEKVIDLMQKHHIRHILVGRRSKIIGIVSLRDLLDKYELYLQKLLHQKEKQLIEEEKMRTVVDEMGDGIVICSRQWGIKEINLAARKYLNISDKLPPNLVNFFYSNFGVSVPKHRFIDAAHPHKIADIIRAETEYEKELILEAHIDFLRFPSGKISDIVLTLRDVTTTRREETLEKNFLSIISHKLRTPLTVVTENASLLRDGLFGPLNIEQRGRMEVLLKSFTGFGKLIERLIEFSTMTSETSGHNAEMIELKRYIPVLISTLIQEARGKKVSLSIAPIDKKASLFMSKAHFEIMIKNVIDNAIKFNDKPVIKISVAATRIKNNIRITIIDNGRGIPPEEYDKIFERFYQIEKRFTGNVEGFGLGLTLVKHLVHFYHGRIDVHSELGKKTVFTMIIPEKIRIKNNNSNGK